MDLLGPDASEHWRRWIKIGRRWLDEERLQEFDRSSAVVGEGMCAVAVSSFGFERRGKPVAAFLRADSKEIRQMTNIYRPHCILCLDPTVGRTVNIFEGVRPGGTLVQTTNKTLADLPLLMVAHRCAYVATASTAFMEDFYARLDRALQASKRGFTYLHVYSPCTTGRRFPAQKNLEIARKAVETNFVMLWEYTPGTGLRLTRSVDEPAPLAEHLQALGKYRHLDPEQVAHIERHIQDDVARIKQYSVAAQAAQLS